MGYGKRNKIKIDIFNYNQCLLGEGGIGKTTLIYNVCEKLAHGTEDHPGYLFLECGKEDGADALANINYLNCPDWSSDYDEFTNSIGFKTVVDDILENKDTEYPNLKVVVVDTYDQLRKIVEPEVIRLHNKENPDKRTTSIKAAFGGFMAGDDKCDDMLLDALWSLKKVGVHFILIGHTKFKDIEDNVTGDTYTQLTTDMSTRSFNKIKTKLHFLGVASIDRSIVKEKKNGKDRGVVEGESRIITFRDNNYCIDSKSRFADIVDQIPMDADAYIKALTDAIESEASKCGDIEALKVEQEEEKEIGLKRAKEFSAKAKEEKRLETLEENRNRYIDTIKANRSSELFVKAKTMLKESGETKFSELPIETLKEIAELFA